MRGRCGRPGPVQRHLTSITCERIPGFTPPERDKAWERGYIRTTYNERTSERLQLHCVDKPSQNMLERQDINKRH